MRAPDARPGIGVVVRLQGDYVIVRWTNSGLGETAEYQAHRDDVTRPLPPTAFAGRVHFNAVAGSAECASSAVRRRRGDPNRASHSITSETGSGPRSGPKSVDLATDLALLFAPRQSASYPLDRLSRYEAILWRQAGQILFALDALDRRKHKIEGAAPVSVAGKAHLADGRDDN